MEFYEDLTHVELEAQLIGVEQELANLAAERRAIEAQWQLAQEHRSHILELMGVSVLKVQEA